MSYISKLYIHPLRIEHDKQINDSHRLAIVTMIAIAGASPLMNNGGDDKDGGDTTTNTVTDFVGRTVEVTESLDNRIMTGGKLAVIGDAQLGDVKSRLTNVASARIDACGYGTPSLAIRHIEVYPVLIHLTGGFEALLAVPQICFAILRKTLTHDTT